MVVEAECICDRERILQIEQATGTVLSLPTLLSQCLSASKAETTGPGQECSTAFIVVYGMLTPASLWKGSSVPDVILPGIFVNKQN